MSRVLDSQRNVIDILECYCCNAKRYLDEPLELWGSIIFVRKSLELMASAIKTFHCTGRCPDDLGLILKKSSNVSFDDLSASIDANRAKALIVNLKKLANDKDEGVSRYLHYQGVRCPSLKKGHAEGLDEFDQGRIEKTYLEFSAKHQLFQLYVREYLLITHQDQLVTPDHHPLLFAILNENTISSLNSEQERPLTCTKSWIEMHCEVLIHLDKIKNQPFAIDTSYVVARMIAEKYCFDQLIPTEKPLETFELEDYLTRLQRHISASKASLPVLQQMYNMENLVRLIQKCSNASIHFRNDEMETICAPVAQLESSLQQLIKTNFHSVNVASSTLANAITEQPAPRMVDELLNIYKKDYRALRNTLEQMNREYARQNKTIEALEARLKQFHRAIILRNCIIAFAASVFLLFGCYYGFNRWFGNRIEHGIYADYIWENGIPTGILPLTANEKNAAGSYYAFTKQGGRVVSVEHINQSGDLVSDVVRTNRAAKITVQYHQDGSLDNVRFYDASGEGIYARRYTLSDLSSIEFNDANAIGTLVYMPSDFVNLQLSDWGSGNSDSGGISEAFSNISSVSVKQRNTTGQATTVTFQHGDEKKSDANGITGFICHYDDSWGRLTAIEYQYDSMMDLQPDVTVSRRYYYQDHHLVRTDSTLGDGSVSSSRYEYDSNGNCVLIRFDSNSFDNTNDISIIRFIYDKQDRLLSQEYLNNEGLNVPCDEGYALLTYRYDMAGRIVETTYRINKDTLTTGPDGWARETIEYSADGQTTTIRYYDQYNNPYEFNGNACTRIEKRNDLVSEYTYFDANGAPTTQKEGVHRIVRERNAEGTWERVTAYQTDGSLYTYAQTGFSTIEKNFDHSGREIKISYFDPNGALCSGGASAITEYQYDHKGNVTLTTRYGADRELLTNDWAFCKKTYDPYGRLVQTEYRNNNKQLVAPKNLGYAKLITDYGSHNEYKLSTTYGTDNQPVNGLDGVFAKRWNYNSANQLVSIHYLNEALQPTLSPRYNYAICEFEYDAASGHKIRERYLDTQGNLILSAHEYAELIWVYDSNGNMVENACLNAEGQLTIPSQYGYAKVEKKYYADGKLASVWLYGANDLPILSERHGYAGLEWQYDHSGRISKWLYYGTDGQLFDRNAEGYAAYSQEYDDYGRTVSWTFYGVDGNPVAPNGMTYSTLRRTFNENGYVNYEAYFSPDGTPVCRDEEEAYSAIHWVRDLSGQIMKVTYLDAADQPMLLTSGYASIAYTYTSNHLTETKVYLDAGGVPVELAEGHAMVVYQYDTDGNKTYQGYYNKSGKAVKYDGSYASIRWKWENGYNVEKSYYDENGALTPYSDYDDYARLRWEYDAQGLVTQRFLYDKAGNPLEGVGDEQAITRYTYDDQGRISTKMYYEADGITSPRYEVAGYRYEYTEQDQISLMQYLGSDGEPILMLFTLCIEDGDWQTYDGGDIQRPYCYEYLSAAQFCWEYDEQARPISLQLLNPAGALMRKQDTVDPLEIHAFYPAVFKWTYDEHGHAVSEYISDSDGMCSVYHETDCYGRTLLITATGEDGKPLALQEDSGYCSLKASYDDEQNSVLFSLFDKQGQLYTDPLLGFAQLRLTYDDALYFWDEYDNVYVPSPAGNCIMAECFDANGKRVISKEMLHWTVPRISGDIYSESSYRWTPDFSYVGSAITRWGKNDNGTHISHYDTNNRLFVNPVQGFAIATYNSVNRISTIKNPEAGTADLSAISPTTAFFDASGQAMVNPIEGYAIMKKTIGADNSELISYHDVNDHLMTNPVLGYAISYIARIPQTGVEIIGYSNQPYIESLYDANGDLVNHALWGYATCNREGDQTNYTITYRDAAGNLVFNPNSGYASMQQTSNRVGTTSFKLTSYFDTSGQLAINPILGYAQLETSYDHAITRKVFRDAEGRIMNHPQWGYAEERVEYGDDIDYVTYFDVEGHIVTNNEVGYAQSVSYVNPYHDTYFYRYLDPNGLDVLSGEKPVY